MTVDSLAPVGAEATGGEVLHGAVSTFDETVGLGTITGDDGRSWPFHCIEIADGTRRIPVGVAVRFRVLARLGRYEAGSIEPS